MRLTLWLAKTGTTVPAFAERIGVSRQALYRYMDGSRFPEQSVRAAIAKATGGEVTADDFDQITAALVGPASGTVSDLLAQFEAAEIWRNVAGWPYQVSSWGSIRREGGTDQLARGAVARYPVVTLSADDVQRTVRVHKLVANASLGPAPFVGAEVAHNDGDTDNCRASNLRWTSPRDNQADRRRHGTHLRGSDVFGAKLTEEVIPIIRQRIERREKYATIAADYGVSVHTISLIKKNKIWRHAGGASWSLAS